VGRDKRLAYVALAVAALSIQASAQPMGSKLVFGQGMNSCGGWTQARQSRSASAGLSAQWVAGYLSGLNVESTSLDPRDDPLLGTDFDGLMAWIDNYCRSHPLESIAIAADKLMDELRERVQRRR
jgi:hypothetical protein